MTTPGSCPAFPRTDAPRIRIPGHLLLLDLLFPFLIRFPKNAVKKVSFQSKPLKGDQLRPATARLARPCNIFVPRLSHLAFGSAGIEWEAGTGDGSTNSMVLPLARQNVNAESFWCTLLQPLPQLHHPKIPVASAENRQNLTLIFPS